MIKVIIISLFVLFSLGTGGVYVLKQNTAPTPQPVQYSPTITSVPAAMESSPTIVNGILYENEKYGFTLLFPKTWDGYKWYSDTAQNIESISFGFPNAGGQTVSVLQINIFTKQKWADATKKPTYITENNDFVFAYGYGSECVQLNEFECARAKEVPSIIQTFKFTQ